MPSKKKTPEKGRKRNRSDNKTPPEKSLHLKKQRQVIDMERLEQLEKKMDSTINLEQDMRELIAKVKSDEPVTASLKEVVSSLEMLSDSVNLLKDEIKSMKSSIVSHKNIQIDLAALRSQNNMLLHRVNDLEDYSRRENVIVNGISERRGEDCFQIFYELLQKYFRTERVEIVRAHRLGSPRDPNRPLIVRLRHYEDKGEIMRNRYMLKGSQIYIDDHYSDQTMRQRQSMFHLLKEVRKVDPRAQLRGAKISTNGRLFDINHVTDLPINPHNACTLTKANVTIFSGRFSHLSNLYPVQLEIDQRSWGSVEQYYQFNKAMDSNDQQAAREILV